MKDTQISDQPFSSWLRQQMKDKQISIGQLERLTGIPKATIHGWMYGRMDNQIERLNALKSAINAKYLTTRQL